MNSFHNILFHIVLPECFIKKSRQQILKIENKKININLIIKILIIKSRMISGSVEKEHRGIRDEDPANIVEHGRPAGRPYDFASPDLYRAYLNMAGAYRSVMTIITRMKALRGSPSSGNSAARINARAIVTLS
jgi:hypothetical protein